MEKIVALAKRRGFIFPSGEIYGGLSGFWDYGPLGVELKNNIKKLWWQKMVYERDDVVGIDGSIITNPKVWEASGHVASFSDPLVECKICHKRLRADKKEEIKEHLKNHLTIHDYHDYIPDPEPLNNFTEPKKFNLLTEVLLGTTEPKEVAYLRGEITQSVFVNFKNIVDTTRVKIPFGIAQIGKAFRNEITPGNFTYRSREFEQMELEFFIYPDEKEGKRWFEYWKEVRMRWYTDLGINQKKLRFRDHQEDERAHYARFATDIEYEAPFGWSEFEGIHHRGDWDLSRHHLDYKDSARNESYIPWVIETSGGVDRALLFFLIDAYYEDDKRVVLKLHHHLAPVKIAVFPLLANKEDLVNKAKLVYKELKSKFYQVAWDDRGNIGKRYFAQDEIGTPFCVTIDFQTLDDESVTVRYRDTAEQERVSISQLTNYFTNKLK
jgi:glycyl-tRNA synthetase